MDEQTCPFCGGNQAYPIATNIYYRQSWYKKLWWYVIEWLHIGSRPYLNIFTMRCPDCGRQGHWYETKEEAARHWRDEKGII